MQGRGGQGRRRGAIEIHCFTDFIRLLFLGSISRFDGFILRFKKVGGILFLNW